MNMQNTDNINTCILLLSKFIKYIKWKALGLWLMAKSTIAQEEQSEVQYKSQGVLDYMPPPKESLSLYIKLL